MEKISIKGVYYPPGTSTRYKAYCCLDENQCYLHIDNDKAVLFEQTRSLHELSITHRLAHIPRRLGFPDGGLFETQENDSCDAWLLANGHPSPAAHRLHLLEKNWLWALCSIILIVSLSVSFVRWGIPELAHQAAFAMPVTTLKTIDEGTLEALDETWLEPSLLPIETRERLEKRFQALLEQQIKRDKSLAEYNFELKFRYIEGDEANAFALPLGTIVVSDGLLHLSLKDAEVEAILLHEIGHVVYRHSLQTVIESALLPLSYAMVTGDAITAADILAILPVFFIEKHYSRSFEHEADDYALSMMHEQGLDLDDFANILERLGEQYDATEDEGFSSYLSSHPAISERIEKIRALNKKK